MAYFLMVLGGALHAASLAWPLQSERLQFPVEGLVAGQSVPWLNVLSLALLAYGLFSAPTARQTALRAWWFASSLLVGSWWWLYISMHTYGGLSGALAVLAVLALATSVALIYAVSGYVFGRLLPSTTAHWAPPWGGVLRRAITQSLGFAGFWLLAELVRGTLFTGFPWGASGYAHVDGSLAKLAPYVGVYGMGAVAALVAGLLASGYQGRVLRWPPIALAAAVMLGLTVAPKAQFTQPAGELAVTLLQGNIAQSEKFQPNTGIPAALRWYQEQLLQAQTPLVLAPETALPLLPQYLPTDYLRTLANKYQATNPQGQTLQLALVGIPWGNREQGYANSVINLVGTYRYDKHHLVPFGEFVPTMFRWFTDLLAIPLSNFSESAAVQSPISFAGQRIAPNICYEDLFGEQMGPLYADAATAPTIMANFSNIAWFGNTIAIDQHRNISRLRTLEFERPMLRSTNTGATVIIDHTGHVTHALPRHTQGALVGQVQGRTGLTPYAWLTSRGGLAALWVLAGLCLGALVLARRPT